MGDKGSALAAMKTKFYDSLFKQNMKSNSCFFLNKDQYDSIVSDVKRIKLSNRKESPRDYRIIKRYDVFSTQGSEKLIEPISGENQDMKFYVHMDEIFDILYSTHLSIGHGGRDKMMCELNKSYKNITRNQIKQFLTLCESCEKKKNSEKKGTDLNLRPMAFSHFSSRCQVDLIDYQSNPDGKYKFLLVYQDQLTKFIILKPLISKQTEEIANNILDIFLLFGAPVILQSENGQEFCNSLIDNLQSLWPELKLILGKPKNSQSEGSLETVNQDIENLLSAWMVENNTNNWSKGSKFVQFMKNRTSHPEIKQSPFEAMFGCATKMGLSSYLPREVLHNFHCEDDLKGLGLCDTEDDVENNYAADYQCNEEIADEQIDEEQFQQNDEHKVHLQTLNDELQLLQCMVDSDSKKETAFSDSNTNSRCQVDLIDYQSNPDGDYKFLLVYQDKLTKFMILKPLLSKQTEEVANNVLDVFLLFGAPVILQSRHGQEFCNSLINNLRSLWPELKLVHSIRTPEHNVEVANQNIKNRLAIWMDENNTNNWSNGARFVQFTKNRTYHAEMKRSPFEAMFGRAAKMGLSSYIPQEVAENNYANDYQCKQEIIDDQIDEFEENDEHEVELDNESLYMVCSKESGSKMIAHINCGKSKEEKRYNKNILSNTCDRKRCQDNHHEGDKADLEVRAKKIKIWQGISISSNVR